MLLSRAAHSVMDRPSVEALSQDDRDSRLL